MKNLREAEPYQNIVVPEGKLESPVTRESGSVGFVSVENRKYELFIREDDNLDLWVKNEQGEKRVLIRVRTNYDDQTRKHVGMMKVEDAELFGKFDTSNGFDGLLDSYMERVKLLSSDYLSKLDSESNNHKIRSHEIDLDNGKKTIEMIHQQQGGDCVLANFLNTWSIENDGRLPCTIDEARKLVVNLRTKDNFDSTNIENPDDGLSPGDIMDLFAMINDCQWQEDDVLTVSGENIDTRQLQLKILDILEYLETYKSKVCATGLGGHARTIKKLKGDNYLLLDPQNEEGVQKMNTDQLLAFLTPLMKDRSGHENFFFFLRNKEDK